MVSHCLSPLCQSQSLFSLSFLHWLFLSILSLCHLLFSHLFIPFYHSSSLFLSFSFILLWNSFHLIHSSLFACPTRLIPSLPLSAYLFFFPLSLTFSVSFIFICDLVYLLVPILILLSPSLSLSQIICLFSSFISLSLCFFSLSLSQILTLVLLSLPFADSPLCIFSISVSFLLRTFSLFTMNFLPGYDLI